VTLSDDVVLLQPLTEDDVPAIVAACQDPEISRWTSVPSPYTEADARAWLESTEEEAFGVFDALGRELLGSIGMRFPDAATGEVGYWVKREARGRGVATRAVVLLVRWGFSERGLARVLLRAELSNVASQRVAERAGFRREGVQRGALELNGERRDVVVFALGRDDSPGPPRATTRVRA
jgi:RimJ/RimL family protein N-acetyltransferase